MLKHPLIFIIIILVSCYSCNNKSKETFTPNEHNEIAEVAIDSIAIVEEVAIDSAAIVEKEPHDWTPKKFKEEHYDEWYVVKHSIDLQQSTLDIDFSKIDKLVHEYISKKSIILPKNPYSKIMKIEEICKDNFDIRGYDESNWGEHVADGTARLFDEYINWLLENEAHKLTKEIDYNKEHEMMEFVMEAFYACCDSIGWAFSGSGGWIGWADAHRIKINFMKSMYEIVLAKQTHSEMPILLTPEHFKEECDKRTANYIQEYEEFTSPNRVKVLLDNYYSATKTWLEYRKEAGNSIKNSNLRREYDYVTRSFARILYIHLKNHFADIGMICSYSMHEECYLHLDCTDEEMLNYSYEEAYNQYMKKYNIKH